MLNLSMKIILSTLIRMKTVIQRQQMSAGRFTGIFSAEHSVIHMAATRYGRCEHLRQNPMDRPLSNWYEVIDQPGAGQMMSGRLLMESRPLPDQDTRSIQSLSLTILPQQFPETDLQVCCHPGRMDYAMIYFPVGRKLHSWTNKGEKIIASWYDPRKGEETN